MIRIFLNQLGKVKCFTQLNFTNAYYQMKIKENS